jgi:DNA segregation ATPase FtsK/SpoIIIE-like protein
VSVHESDLLPGVRFVPEPEEETPVAAVLAPAPPEPPPVPAPVVAAMGPPPPAAPAVVVTKPEREAKREPEADEGSKKRKRARPAPAPEPAPPEPAAGSKKETDYRKKLEASGLFDEAEASQRTREPEPPAKRRAPPARTEPERDPLFLQAVEAAIERGAASPVLLTRRLGIGYDRARALMDRLVDEGVVGEMTASGSRPVLITRDDWKKTYGA